MHAHLEPLVSPGPKERGLGVVVRMRLLGAPRTGSALARRLERGRRRR